MDFNGDLNLATLQPAPVFPELYQELWWYSGSYASTPVNQTTPGASCLQKGATGMVASNNVLAKLYTFSANWNANTKCAFEAAIWNNSSGDATYAELWDVTSNTAVAGSQISLASGSTPTVLRSGQFTLIPGHNYGVTVWTNSGIGEITDASLIVFPSSPLTSPSVSVISLANPSGNALKEAYIPLWVYSSGTASNASSTISYLQKGSTSITTSNTGSAIKLYTLSSSWNPNALFALEASIYSGTAGSNAVVGLYDFTQGGQVVNVLTTNSTATLIRSSSLKLTPGHVYGISLQSAGSNTAYLTKAHLVALAQ